MSAGYQGIPGEPAASVEILEADAELLWSLIYSARAELRNRSRSQYAHWENEEMDSDCAAMTRLLKSVSGRDSVGDES